MHGHDGYGNFTICHQLKTWTDGMGWDSKHHAMNDPEGTARGSHSSPLTRLVDRFTSHTWQLNDKVHYSRSPIHNPIPIQFIPCLFPIDLTVL
jgi:hypothetical protein